MDHIIHCICRSRMGYGPPWTRLPYPLVHVEVRNVGRLCKPRLQQPLVRVETGAGHSSLGHSNHHHAQDPRLRAAFVGVHEIHGWGNIRIEKMVALLAYM